MPLEWSAVTATHVQQACDLVAVRQGVSDRNAGLVVFADGRRLPAKAILREAYRLAKGMPPDAVVTFASGEATLNVLRKLGFRAERVGSRTKREPVQ
jgi:hypothetical protein